MKNKKVWIIVAPLLTILCVCMAAGGFALYKFVSNPTVEAGMNQLGDDLQQLAALRTWILKEYDVEDVSVQLVNGNTLVITLFNFRELKDASAAKTSERALEIASKSIEAYISADKIQGVVIKFTQKQNFLIFYTYQTRTYSFPTAKVPK